MGSTSDAVPDPGNHRSPAGDASPVTDTKIHGEETASLRRTRPSRACTVRAQQRLQEQQAAERKFRPPKKEHRPKEKVEEEEDDEEEEEDDVDDDALRQCGGGGSSGKLVTSLVQPPEPSQMPRWNLRSMWELASVLNFLHVFRPLLKINAEFSAEEFETALLNPNDTLSDIHIPLLKAIPPVTRMALTRDTWVTVLCRKIRDCWHWVAEGDLPIVASQGRETEVYKSLDPAIRVVILKALCDIRVEQDDIRSYIDNSVKTGVHLSTFRKGRVGGDSHGVNFWYEDDSSIGHRLYREIRKAEVVKVKTKGSKIPPNVTYQWETVATNFDEFQDVSEKLNSSSSRAEISLGKKLTRDMLPEIEKEHKRKEKLLKKQHRQALLLDNHLVVDGVGGGRSRRDRKPVRYTFDDYDRSINEAINISTKKHPSEEPFLHRRESARLDSLVNGRSTSSSHPAEPVNDTASGSSSDFADGDEFDEQRDESLDRRRRQRPQRYSATDFVETVPDNHVESESDDDIVGEAVYDDEYLRKRKQKKFSSGSEGEEEKGDEEYKWDEDNAEYEEEEEEEEEEEDSPSASEEDSDEPRRVRKMPRRGTKLRSRSNGSRPGLRRSKRATRIDYQQYELSESDNEAAAGAAKRKRLVEPDPDEDSDESGNGDFTMGSEDSEENADDPEENAIADDPETNSAEEVEEEEEEPREVNDNAGTANGTENNNQLNKSNGTDQEEVEGVLGKRHYLDLNELAPVSGFDDGPSTVLKDDDKTDN
ncbi:DDT domain superfamily [Raphanus sativus]|uniref:DDT domain-containing protein DDR4 isoform X2 n=1 Tax=Raphanus sativus TaxID=3726 RepID=A0A6J0JS96_RAPSA|nr:DDT domain-containing protein DDR4 isoform X2 [Raphanus sativus]KAJ4916151.1 DDT domain superfamily [Raphanus sativus]